MVGFITTTTTQSVSLADLEGGRLLRATNFLLSGSKIIMSAPSVYPDVVPKIEKNYHFRPKPIYEYIFRPLRL